MEIKETKRNWRIQKRNVNFYKMSKDATVKSRKASKIRRITSINKIPIKKKKVYPIKYKKRKKKKKWRLSECKDMKKVIKILLKQ